MTYSIAALGESGARLVRAMLYAGVAGALPEDTLHVTLIGADARTEQELDGLVRDYGAVHAHLAGRGAKGFTAAFSLQTWPAAAQERLSLNDQAESEEDQLLCRALFTREQAALSPRHSLDVSGPVAAMTLSSLLSGAEADALWEQLRTGERVLLLGGLCEPVGAAGVAALADFVMRCGGGKPCAAMLLPFRTEDDDGLCRAALMSGGLDERLSAAVVVGMPECARVAGAQGAHLVEWLAALGGAAMLRGERQGMTTWALPEDEVSWQLFGPAGETLRRCYDGALRAAGMMNALYGPQLCAALSSRSWLRDRMLTWYNRHFDAARRLDEAGQNALIQDVRALMALYGGLATWLSQVQTNLPMDMRWPGAMHRAAAEAEEHYGRVLELAGQVAWLRFEAERSGMAEERFVHRHSMEDSEAEATLRQIEEMQNHLHDLLEEQYALNNYLGGALTRRMLTRLRRAADAEAADLDAQAREGRRRIARAAQLATPEEQPRVEKARVRLERMERHVALLRGRAEQARRDEVYYSDAARRSAQPKLDVSEEAPEVLYPEKLLESIQALADAEGKAIKQQGQQLYEAWPWPDLLPKQITDAMGERPPQTTQDSLGDFLTHLLAVTRPEGREGEA